MLIIKFMVNAADEYMRIEMSGKIVLQIGLFGFVITVGLHHGCNSKLLDISFLIFFPAIRLS